MSPLKASGQYVYYLWHALSTWSGAKSVTRNGDIFRCAFTSTLVLHSGVNCVIRLDLPIRIGEIVQTSKRTNKTETQQIYWPRK